MQAWSARQATTHSPVIMQSVTSTQVKKPALQKATEPAVAASAAVVGQVQPQMALPLTLPPSDFSWQTEDYYLNSSATGDPLAGTDLSLFKSRLQPGVNSGFLGRAPDLCESITLLFAYLFRFARLDRLLMF